MIINRNSLLKDNNSPKTKHYYYLDIIRFCSALSVMMGHARCELFVTYGDLNIESQNFFSKVMYATLGCFTVEGMICFFLLSGFLVGGPMIAKLYYLSTMQAGEDEYITLSSSFIKKRFIRIIVPLVIAVLIVIGVRLFSHQPVSLSEAILNVFGLQGVLASDFGWVYWSLAYEIWFYVSIAAIISLFCPIRQKMVGSILLVMCGMVLSNCQ